MRIVSDRRWRVRGAVAVVSCLVVSACAGPQDPLEVGVKEVPTDVVMGAEREELLTAVLAPPNGLPTRPLLAPMTLPSVAPPTSTPAPTPVCPAADPLSAPRLLAPNVVPGPPKPAVFEVRNRGHYEVSGANADQGVFPSQGTREVKDVSSEGGVFTWDLVGVLGDTTTTTRFRSDVNGLDQPTQPPGPVGPGLYIDRITTEQGGATVTFETRPGIALAKFPVQIGSRVQGAVSDPSVGLVMHYTSTIRGKGRVDACGVLLDAYVVEFDGTVAECAETPLGEPVCLPEGGALSVDARNGRQQIEATYMLGTQYGGLLLQDHVVVTSTMPGSTVLRENEAVINREPEPAG